MATADDIEAQKKKILQIFLEDRRSQAVKPVILRANEKLWALAEKSGYDRVRYNVRLFFNGTELIDWGKTLFESNIPTNSTVHYEATAVAVMNQPPEDDLIPCEMCAQSFPSSTFLGHACMVGNAKPAARQQQRQQQASPKPSSAGGKKEDEIPCERCSKMIAFSGYMDHASVCGFADGDA